MNHTELLELDAYIAQHVMGWTAALSFRGLGLGGGQFYKHPDKTIRVRDRSATVVVFAPSTDPAAAMAVLEKCITKTPHTICFGHGDGFCIYLGGQFGRRPTGDAPTLPLAICLFAKQLFSE